MDKTSKIEQTLPQKQPLNTTNLNTPNPSSDVESDNDSSIISASTVRSETSSNRRNSKSRGRKSKSKSIVKPTKSYKLNCFVSEEGNKQIFAVQFNHFIKTRNIFATASGFRISIYECVNAEEDDEENEDFCGIKLLRAYDDPDRGEFF